MIMLDVDCYKVFYKIFDGWFFYYEIFVYSFYEVFM